MKNYDKYIEELKNTGRMCEFIKTHLTNEEYCYGKDCTVCKRQFFTWLDSEYIPQIDWSKVPVDTPVMWKTSSTTEREVRRYFAYVVGDMLAIYEDGRPSWTATSTFTVEPSKLRLAFQDDIEKYSI